jgi:hypothetical protein
MMMQICMLGFCLSSLEIVPDVLMPIQGSYFGTSTFLHHLIVNATLNVKHLFDFLLPTLSTNFTFPFSTTYATSKMLTMVDLEGPPPHSVAASLDKESCHSCSQVSCCFGLGIVLCLLCFVVSSASPLSLFAMLLLVVHPSLTNKLFLPYCISCWLFVGLLPSILHGFLDIFCCWLLAVASLHNLGRSSLAWVLLFLLCLGALHQSFLGANLRLRNLNLYSR